MALTLPVEEDVLWGCSVAGSERYPRGRRYWWDNRRREGRAACVQASLEGTIDHRWNGRTHLAGPGTLLLFVYGEDSQYGRPEPLDEPYRCAWVQLKGAGVVEHVVAIRRLVGPVIEDEPGQPLIEELHRLSELSRRRDADAPLAVAAATQRLVMSLYESSVRRRRRELSPVERAVERLLSQPLAGESVEQVADRFGVSREHLTRVFRDRTGHPPAKHLTRMRVERALRLLRTTDLAVADVARQVGLGSAAALARHVRRVTGGPPGALRTGRP